MKVLLRLFALVALVWFGTAQAADLENTLYLQLKTGRVVIALRPDLAPNHVKRIKTLVRRGFYDGLTFHRVIQGFMAQTGDPNGDGTGGSGQTITAEFSNLPFDRGVVGMARSDLPDSADTQFFIMTGRKASLDHHYTAWGQVTAGMELVDQLKAGDPNAGDGRVADNPDKIIRMDVAADVEKGKS